MDTQRACVFSPHALCGVRHTMRARARALLRTEALCVGAILFTRSSSEGLKLPFLSEEILSGYEDLSPRAQIISLRVWRQTLMPQYGKWSMFKQNFERRQKGETIHVLKHSVSTKLNIVRLCKSESACTIGIQDLDVAKKMLPETNRKQVARSS